MLGRQIEGIILRHRILLSAPGPFGFNWVLELIRTWLELGLRGFGTKGLGPGLDNYRIKKASFTNQK